MRSNYFDIVCQ